MEYLECHATKVVYVYTLENSFGAPCDGVIVLMRDKSRERRIVIAFVRTVWAALWFTVLHHFPGLDGTRNLKLWNFLADTHLNNRLKSHYACSSERTVQFLTLTLHFCRATFSHLGLPVYQLIIVNISAWFSVRFLKSGFKVLTCETCNSSWLRFFNTACLQYSCGSKFECNLLCTAAPIVLSCSRRLHQSAALYQRKC